MLGRVCSLGSKYTAPKLEQAALEESGLSWVHCLLMEPHAHAQLLGGKSLLLIV